MAETEEYQMAFEKSLSGLLYRLLREKLFTALGLELSATGIRLFSRDNFPIPEQTFAFFNPIDNTLNINIDDPFFTKANLPDRYQGNRNPLTGEGFSPEDEFLARMLFILFHEASHKLLMHTERRGNRLPFLWNIAADYEIHNLLHLYCEICRNENGNEFRRTCVLIHEMLEKSAVKSFRPDPKKGQYKFLFCHDFLGNIAEEIYLKLEKTKKTKQTSFKIGLSRMMKNARRQDQDMGQRGSGPEVTVTETTFKLPDGTEYTSVEYDWPTQPQLPDHLRRSQEEQKNDRNNATLRKQMMEHELRSSVEKQFGRGNISQNGFAFIQKLLAVRIDWEKILRLSLQTILCRSDYCTWSRPRQSMYALDMYLPDIAHDNEEYGVLIIARDESGSMSDEQIARCGAIIADAKEHYQKIIILKHDTEIRYQGEFEELTDDSIQMLCTRNARGGTSHRAVFEFIADYATKHPYEEEAVSCVILLTDGVSDILKTQHIVPDRIPMVYLVPKHSRTAGFRGKVIPIDL